MSKYIITKAYNQGDWFNKDVALISITDKFKEKLKEIRDFINSAPESFRSNVDVSLYNAPIYFYDSSEIDFDDDLVRDVKVVSDFLESEEFNNCVVIDDVANLSFMEGIVQRVDTLCVVDYGGVMLKAYNQYGDGEEMWTDPIDFEMILNF